MTHNKGYFLQGINSFSDLPELIAKSLQKHHNLFSQPVLISENKSLSEWLKKQIAAETGIFAGISFYEPESFINKSLRFFISEENLKKVPGSGEMELLIFKYFSDVSADKIKADSRLTNFLDKLEKEGGVPTKIKFASLVARKIALYAKAAPCLCKRWEKDELYSDNNQSNEIWQKDIFRFLFHQYESITPWYQPIEEIIKNKPEPLVKLPPLIIIAGYLPQFSLVYDFLLYCSNFIPIHHFSVYPQSYEDHSKADNPFSAQCINEYSYLRKYSTTNALKKKSSPLSTLSVLREYFLFNKKITTNNFTPDNSFKIISCPGKVRQAEAARDLVLDTLDNNPDISLEDIAVLAPDISHFRPSLEAVFSQTVSSSTPAGISLNNYDISILEVSPVISVFTKLMQLADSSFSLTDLDAIFNNPCFARSQELDYESLQNFRELAKELNMVRNVDEEHAFTNGEKEFRYNTLENGWLRLFLNYAFGEGCTFNDYQTSLLNHDENKTGQIMQAVYELDSSFCRLALYDRSLSEWCRQALSWLDKFIALRNGNRDDSRDYDILCQILKDLEEEDIIQDPVDHTVFFHLAEERLERIKIRSGSGVVSGNLRNFSYIPFKAVIVLGMDHKSFPMDESINSIDLMKDLNANFSPTWISAAKRDRQYFLNLFLLNSRQLYFCYNGEDIHKGEEKPPSLLLAKITDFLTESLSPEDLSSVLIKYPLKDYDPLFFSKRSDLFTYDHRSYAACKAKYNNQATSDNFLTQTREELSEIENLTPHDLILFLKNPALSYLKHAEGLYLHKSAPYAYPQIKTDHIGFYDSEKLITNLTKTLCDENTTAHEISSFINKCRLNGDISSDAQAEYLVRDLLSKIRYLRNQTSNLSFGVNRNIILSEPDVIVKNDEDLLIPPLEIHTFDNSKIKVSGTIDDVSDLFLTVVKNEIKDKDLISSWIKFLLLKSHPDLHEDFAEFNSVVVSLKNKNPRFYSAEISHDRAREILCEIISAFHNNLKKPLPLYPEICFKTLALLEKNHDDTDNVRSAIQKNLEVIKSRKDDAELVFKDFIADNDILINISHYAFAIYNIIKQAKTKGL